MRRLNLPDDCSCGHWSSKMCGSSVWDRNHVLTRQKNLCSKIGEYYKNGKYADVKITCQNRIFKCHRLVLAAVSEYFEAMFGGDFIESHTQEVTLGEIDSVTFEQVIHFAYNGEIAAINDDNVLDLLRASDILQLRDDMEHHCFHYLTEKNIPMDCALQLHLFASAANKVSLIPFTSRFLLQHLDHFCRDRDFLQMSFRELSTILSYFVGTSWDEEKALLNVILQWLSGRSTSDIPKDRRRSSFMELAQKVPFKFVSAEYVAEFYDNSNGGADDNDVTGYPLEISVATDLDSRTNPDEPALHVYTKHFNTDGERVSSVLSLRMNRGGLMGWGVSAAITPFIEEMRVIQSDGRLYCLKMSDEEWTFSVSTAIDLSTDGQILTLPSGFIMIPPWVVSSQLERSNFSLCHMKSTHNIYLGGLHEHIGFQCYNTDLDAWSVIPSSVSEQFEPTKNVSLICDDYRLFMIGWKKNTASYSANLFSAYDPRTAKPEILNHKGLSHLEFPIHGWTHKSRIYVTGHERNDFRPPFIFHMAIYDPFAGRWDAQKFSYSCEGCECIGRHINHQLVTFNNQLWMFGFADSSSLITSICAQSYDSFLQTWSSENEDIHTTMCGKLRQRPIHFLDAVEF